MGFFSMVRSSGFIFCFGVQIVRMFSLNGSQSPTATITPALAAAMVSSQSPTAVKLEEPGLSTSVAQEDKWSRCSGAEAGEKQEKCVKLPGYSQLWWWGIDTQRWYQFAFCMWLLHGFQDEQKTDCFILSVCINTGV